MSIFLKRKNNFKKFKTEMNRRFPLRSASIKIGEKKGMVSVVLPVFNCDRYLKESIESVLNQEYSNIELIIVDDGSNDCSGEIADSYLTDGRVKVIHQKNMRLPAALNNGFKIARGEYYTWTSADNVMLPECLEILVAELERNRDCDMVFGNMKLIDENGDILRGKGWYELPPFSGNVILPDSAEQLNTVPNNTIGAAFLYRGGAAAVLQPYNRFMLEDYDYFMRMNSLFSVKHTICKKPIYMYRMHKESLTARDEELGITASRPELMAFDKFRREFYLKNTVFYIDGLKNQKSLLQSIDRVHSVRKAEELAKNKHCNIGYINVGNVPQTWIVPDNIPKILITDKVCGEVYDYDTAVYTNKALSDDKYRISISENRALSAFVSLYTKEYLLRQAEI